MKVLVACEYTGRVRRTFRKRGHDAWSCDIRDPKIPSPYHLKCDVRQVLLNHWDMMIAFPPCTYLSRAGNAWRSGWEEDGLVDEALDFVMLLLAAPIPRIAVENPVGVINTAYRKPDQIIQPWQFGHPYTKATCLWLKNLPLLRPTSIVTPTMPWVSSGSNHVPGGQRLREKREATFMGVAVGMAEQWGKL